MKKRPTRRRFMQVAAAAGLSSLINPSGAFAKTGRSQKKKPNVLFIAIDDLNDWIGPLGGHPDTLTPNLDRLAKRSLVFTNAECAAPCCVPSRTAMFTGILPEKTGYYDNYCGFYRQNDKLKDVVTLPQYFTAHGYFTAGTGKITHHADVGAWDEFWNKPYWVNPWPEWYDGSTNDRTREWVPTPASREEMTDWKSAEWAAEKLKKEYDKPFFIGCGFFLPHEPWFVPKEYYDKFDLDKLTLPEVKLDDMDDVGKGQQKKKSALAKKCIANHDLWRKGVRGYLASINFADDCLGLVLDALDHSEYRDNTIVLLWSDHGFHLGEKYNWSKFKLWEESARCVLMCSAPGVTTGGTRCAAPVNLVDMYPTLIDLCGIPSKDGLGGISFVPQLKNPATKRNRPSVTANPEGFSLRTEQYRYIWYYDGAEELYDHRKDPMEWNNLAGKPEYRYIKEKLKAFVPKNPAPKYTQPKKGKKKKKKLPE